jgi:superfamily II helicase
MLLGADLFSGKKKSMITLKNMQKVKQSERLKQPKEKVCNRCGKKKKLKQFKTSGKCKDGHENVCLDCYSIRNKELKQDRKDANYF